jgi:hypothetical protein
MKIHQFYFKVRWGDKKEGYGEHYWEYNHGPQEYKAAPSVQAYKPVEYKPETPVYVPSYNS